VREAASAPDAAPHRPQPVGACSTFVSDHLRASGMEKVYVFNPSLGGEDTAERKVLFFHPASTPVSEQVNSVGLCEALTNFTRTFGPTSSSSEPLTLHTQQRRHVFFEAEAGIWFAVVSRNAALPKSASRGSSATTAEPAGAAPAEPSEEELQDSTLHALLRRVYEGVQLACGQLSLIAAERGWEGLRRLLAAVMRPYLQIMLSQGEDETARLDVLDTFDGMSFLPIDSLLYLKVQMALNQLLTHQPNVVHTALFFEGQLVYSSLSRGGTQQLHRLVTKMMGGPATKKPEPLPDLSRAADEEHLFALVHALRHSAKPSALPAGRFVCGAGDLLQDDRSAVRVPLVHVEVRRRAGGETEPGPPENRPGEPSMHLEKGEADLEAFRLVVFELQQSVVVMLLDDKPPLWSRPLWFQEARNPPLSRAQAGP